MKSIIIKIVLITLFFGMFNSNLLVGQKNQDSLALVKKTVLVLPKAEKSKIVIRWVPKDFNWFTLANEYGYVIERATFSKDPRIFYDDITEEDFVTKPLQGMPLMPWTVEEFKKNIKSEKDVYLGVAMEILHGEMSVKGSLNKGSNLANSVMEQENRFAFALTAADLNKEAAISLALRYEDSNVEKGKFYTYRIYINYADQEFKSDTTEFTLQFKAVESAKSKVENFFIEPSDKEVLLSWTHSNKAFFSAYDIERSLDQKIWTKLNDKPYISSIPENVESYVYTYVDDSLQNAQKYFYRVIGYTPFGDKGLYSDTLHTVPKDMTAPSPAFKINAIDTGGVVMISWDAAPYEPDFDCFYIGRSTSANGPFEKISPKLPKSERGFIDFSPLPLEENYYVIISSDSFGNESQSFSALGYIVDITPPVKPTWVSGSIDSTGLVRLEWNRGPDADIIGYRVYWANDTLSEFSQLKGEVHSHTVFLDSVNVKTLNKFTYYKITAVDHRYNHSVYSEIIAIEKPDLISPAVPVFNNYNVVDHKINFSWFVSSSDDVVTQIVEKSQDSDKWIVLTQYMNNTTNTFIDSTLVTNRSYSYRVTAVDKAGNKNISKPLSITHHSKGKVKGDIQLTFKIEDNKALLSWTTDLNPVKFILSKKNANDYQRLAVVPDNQNKFLDSNYSDGDIYYIKAIMKDGSETPNITTK